MADEKRLIDKRWETIFAECDVLNRIEQNSTFTISSENIRNKFGFEPRLLAKFDHHFQQPRCFTDNSISILPIDRGNYLLSHFDNFKNFDEDESTPLELVALPEYIETLYNTTSEANSLNAASAAGIFTSFFETNEVCSALNGRMGSGQFDFNINNLHTQATMPVSVDKAQIEVDASFEGITDFFLIEAKMAEQDDFLIRQLYYPYRAIANVTNKNIRPIFFTCTNGVYNLREYQFLDPLNYNSLELIKSRKYRIKDKDEEEVSFDSINTMMRSQPYVNETNQYPFPQADSFQRVINLCTTIKDNPDEFISLEFLGSQVSFTKSHNFTMRQVQYYVSAAEYLGLIVKYKDDEHGRTAGYTLTPEAYKLLSSPYNKMNMGLILLIMRHKPFHLTYIDYCRYGEMPSLGRIVEHMKSSDVNIGENSMQTFRRRASSISGWIFWVTSIITR